MDIEVLNGIMKICMKGKRLIEKYMDWVNILFKKELCMKEDIIMGLKMGGEN